MPSTSLRSFLKILLSLIAAVPLLGLAQTTDLRLVSTPWRPFTGSPGQPRFALDLVDAALGRDGVRSTTSIVEPARFTAALLGGPFDGSAAVWKDPERERALYFSEPYLENRLILVGRKGADVSAPALGALKGARIAIVEGYSYGNIDSTGPMFVRSHSDEDSLKRLLAKSVDYALMDDLVVQFIIDTYPKESKERLQLGSTPLVTRALHLALRRSLPDAEQIVLRFNGQLRAMIADRTYHRLLHVSWIQADVNGDGLTEYIPASDKAGTAPPQHAYTLFTEPRTTSPRPKLLETERPGFYVGGTIYTDWASVPKGYKVADPAKPHDPSRSTASVFKFVW